MESKNYNKTVNVTKTSQLTENKLVVSSGEREGEGQYRGGDSSVYSKLQGHILYRTGDGANILQ